jgi:DNA polymerase III delta subunit
MNRIDQLILNKYPNQLDQIKNQIELLKLDYDQDQFLEEDIIESILIELNII